MSIKVLWFVNVPTAAIAARLGRDGRGSGGWLEALLQSVGENGEFEYCVCCACPATADESFVENGVAYRIMAQPRYFPELREKRLLEKCAAAVWEWQPDIIHIHGTERFYGLLAGYPGIADRIPIAASLQGILTSYARWENYCGTLNPAALAAVFHPWEWVTGRGLFHGWRRLCAQARREQRFCRNIPVFFGRTDWDRAWGRVLNPTAGYYRVGEVLRADFFRKQWALERCRWHQVVFTNAGHPRRGKECLIEALQLLRDDFPDLKLVLAGNLSPKKSYNRYLLKKLRASGIATELKGLCTGAEIAELLEQSHVFVLSSLIENSPNSLCEAQAVGTPAVAADVGGVSSLVTHEKTGLLFPRNDAPLLAERIRRIFTDDVLACEMSIAARALAAERNGALTVREELFTAYRAMVTGKSQKETQE